MAKNGITLTEMAAEIGADQYIKSQEENEKLRQQLAGLGSDRDALAEIAVELRKVLHQVARRAAMARQNPLMARRWADELCAIQEMCDKALRG